MRATGEEFEARLRHWFPESVPIRSAGLYTERCRLRMGPASWDATAVMRALPDVLIGNFDDWALEGVEWIIQDEGSATPYLKVLWLSFIRLIPR